MRLIIPAVAAAVALAVTPAFGVSVLDYQWHLDHNVFSISGTLDYAPDLASYAPNTQPVDELVLWFDPDPDAGGTPQQYGHWLGTTAGGANFNMYHDLSPWVSTATLPLGVTGTTFQFDIPYAAFGATNDVFAFQLYGGAAGRIVSDSGPIRTDAVPLPAAAFLGVPLLGGVIIAARRRVAPRAS